MLLTKFLFFFVLLLLNGKDNSTFNTFLNKNNCLNPSTFDKCEKESIKGYSIFCLSNCLNVSITYRVSWDGSEWIRHSINPGEYKWHYDDYPSKPKIKFVADFDDYNISKNLKTYRSNYASCEYARQYHFSWTDRGRIFAIFNGNCFQ